MGPANDSPNHSRDQNSVRRTKVGRVIDDYGLDGLGERLARSWRGDGVPRRSLRELADECNGELLTSVLADSDISPVPGEIENLHRLLTDDSVSTAATVEAEQKLERAGVDVERLREDFVSHQAIHTYLRKFRGVEPPMDRGSSHSPVRSRMESIQRLRNRLAAVAETGLADLRNAERLSLDSFDVIVGVTVHCNECGASHDITEVLKRGGCGCIVNEAG